MRAKTLARLTEAQRTQAEMLQRKIDRERNADNARQHLWANAKFAYLRDGDESALIWAAETFYEGEPFTKLQTAVARVAVEISLLVANRNALAASQTPALDVEPEESPAHEHDCE